MKRILHMSLIFLTLGAFVSCTNDVSMGDKESETKKTQTPLPGDVDGDGVLDENDNCPTLANADQADEDGNGTGDLCEGLSCVSNFCEDKDFLSGWHCDGNTSVLCDLDPDSSGCLAKLTESSCSNGCQTDGVQAGLCAAPQPNPNDPNIISVSGDALHGSTLSLSGEYFGSHSLDVEWTGDWIESQSDGADPTAKPGWSHLLQSQGPRDHISSENPWSGSRCVDLSVDQTQDPGSWESTWGFTHGDYGKIYAVYWAYIEPLAHKTGPNVYQDTGWKGIYLSLKDHGPGAGSAVSAPTNSLQIMMAFDKARDQVTERVWGSWAWVTCPDVYSPSTAIWEDAVGVGYDLHPDPYFTGYINRGGDPLKDYSPTIGQWTRVEIYADSGVPDMPTGEVMNAVLDPTSNNGRMIGSWAKNLVLRTNRTDCRSNPNPWENFIFQYMYDDAVTHTGSPNLPVEKAKLLVDDVYLQFGSRAHLEVGDQPSYEDCTRLEVQIPKAWTNDGIDFQLNYGGSFSAGEEVYVFVVRDDGRVSPGYEVVLE